MRSINLRQLGIIVSAKLSGKWPSGSEEEVEYVGKTQRETNRRTTAYLNFQLR